MQTCLEILSIIPNLVQMWSTKSFLLQLKFPPTLFSVISASSGDQWDRCHIAAATSAGRYGRQSPRLEGWAIMINYLDSTCLESCNSSSCSRAPRCLVMPLSWWRTTLGGLLKSKLIRVCAAFKSSSPPITNSCISKYVSTQKPPQGAKIIQQDTSEVNTDIVHILFYV